MPNERSPTFTRFLSHDPAPLVEKNTRLQRYIIGFLAVGLLLIGISSFTGWSAIVEIDAIEKRCEGADCFQIVSFGPLQTTLSVPADAEIAVGDLLNIRVECAYSKDCEIGVQGIIRPNSTPGND